MKLTNFKALSFDCYGTLIDWETGILAALQTWREANGIEISDDKLLSLFGECESFEEADLRSAPYPEILEGVHIAMCRALEVRSNRADREALATSVGDWPLFPDTVKALRYLKKNFKLIILSNVDRDSFTLSSKKLEVEFDASYVAGEIYTYKPQKNNFRYMLEHAKADLGLEKGDFLHTAQSLFHDHKPAIEMGFTTCWIDRRGSDGGGATPELEEPIEPHFRFSSMAEMADAVKAEVGD